MARVELKAARRVWVAAGGALRVELEVRRAALGMVGPGGGWGVLAGEYRVYVGGCGPMGPVGPLQPPLQGMLVVQ